MSTQVYVSLGHFFYLPPPPPTMLLSAPSLLFAPRSALSFYAPDLFSGNVNISFLFSTEGVWGGHTHTQRSLSHTVCTSVCMCVWSEGKIHQSGCWCQLNSWTAITRSVTLTADRWGHLSAVSGRSVVLTSFCSDQIVDRQSLFQTPREEKIQVGGAF